MNPKLIFIIIALIALLFGSIGIKMFPSKIEMIPKLSNLISEKPTRDVYLGFWTHGLWDDENRELNPEKLKELENKIDKKVAIAHLFRGWHHLEEASLSADLNTLSDNGWRPMISANPYFFDSCTAPKGMTLYKAIWLGNCDQFLRRAAKNLKTVKEPFFFRFAWEMNVNSMEWSIQRTGSYNEEYINAWKRVHDIFKEEGVTNAIWVFSPQVDTPTTMDIAKLYPGDEYVDWVALDGYNWGKTRSWSSWQSFKDVFFNSYQKLHALAPSKPFMIAEVNSVEIGGDRASWYKDMLMNEIPNDFPDIKAIVFFNEDKTKQEGINWLIDSSSNSLDSFREAIQNPIYKSEFK